MLTEANVVCQLRNRLQLRTDCPGATFCIFVEKSVHCLFVNLQQVYFLTFRMNRSIKLMQKRFALRRRLVLFAMGQANVLIIPETPSIVAGE